jgi:mannose-6-phosphate isomerase-like protein (cupin superfamily)
MAKYSVAQLEEIHPIEDGRAPFRAVRHHFGIQTFGVNAMYAQDEGVVVINEHSETDPDSSEELYLVIRGHATFEVDGDSVDAPTGTFVHVEPGVKRSAVAREPGTTVLVIGGAPPGKPYQAHGWELFAPLFPLFESGDYEEGADRAAALLESDPPHGAIYYNTACFEARAGRTELALTHLRRGVELSPHLAELARTDDDLESLREFPSFTEIVGG